MTTDSSTNMGRLIELIRHRWEQLDWQTDLPTNGPVISETHYLDVQSLSLPETDRWKLNRMLACFTCELFIHFERYLVEFLERHRRQIDFIPKAAIDRFVAEEKVHTASFYRLLCKLRPDLYATHNHPREGMRFLVWSIGDEAAVSFAPVASFFLLAWLFEEITIFLPIALNEQQEQCSPLVSEVMKLHAKEEVSHVAIDERILLNLKKRQSYAKCVTDTILSVPILAYADTRAKQGWAKVVELLRTEIDLNQMQTERLLRRGPSKSDRMGITSFANKIEQSHFPLTSILAQVLRLELRRHTA